MNYRPFFLILFLAMAIQIVVGQSKDYSQDEQRVRVTILDFNQIVFKEMDLSKAIETHLFLGQPDSIDLKYGLEIDFSKFFQNKPRNITKKEKIKIVASEFYSSLNIPLLYWHLGEKPIQPDTKFTDSSIASDKNLEKVWLEILSKMKLTEDKIDELDEIEDRKIIENLSVNFNSAIASKINKQIYNENLEIIYKNTEIKKEAFEGREYFIVENSLFNYTVAIKNGIPKIMRINRS
ncbi:MAG: hypothetical protein JSS81_19750 [Acidobacteria bacterium]|nr:hypothetical protein [Acidobacteriota bacterium]